MSNIEGEIYGGFRPGYFGVIAGAWNQVLGEGWRTSF